MLKCGVATSVITPEPGLFMSGYPDTDDRFGTDAHDELYAAAFYFSNEGIELLYITNDLVSIAKERSAAARRAIADVTGIPFDHVAIGCTHTHSGPVTGVKKGTNRFTETEEAYPAYNDFLHEKLLSLATAAKAAAFPAKLGVSHTVCGKEAGIGGNRHRPDGAADPTVSVIGIRDMADRLRGCIVNYALHPTLLHKENRRYSADYPGYLRKSISASYPAAVFGFMEGCAGNQSTRFFRTGQTFEEAKRYGDTLGAAAKRVLEQMTFETDARLGAAETSFLPLLKNPLPKDAAAAALLRAESALKKLQAEAAPYSERRSAECTLFGAQYNLALAEAVEHMDIEAIRARYFPLCVTVLRLGDAAVVCVSTEAFVELGLGIRAQSPFRETLLSTVTNGYGCGYCCADYAYDAFCYEAQTSMYRKGAVAQITGEAVTLLNRLYRA